MFKQLLVCTCTGMKSRYTANESTSQTQYKIGRGSSSCLTGHCFPVHFVWATRPSEKSSKSLLVHDTLYLEKPIAEFSSLVRNCSAFASVASNDNAWAGVCLSIYLLGCYRLQFSTGLHQHNTCHWNIKCITLQASRAVFESTFVPRI